jgi:hypothetical protein
MTPVWVQLVLVGNVLDFAFDHLWSLTAVHRDALRLGFFGLWQA